MGPSASGSGERSVAAGAAWVWGWGAEPKEAKTRWCFTEETRGEGG